MQKNSFIVTMLLLSIIANCIFIYSEFHKRTSIDENSIIKIFNDKENMEILSEAGSLKLLGAGSLWQGASIISI